MDELCSGNTFLNNTVISDGFVKGGAVNMITFNESEAQFDDNLIMGNRAQGEASHRGRGVVPRQRGSEPVPGQAQYLARQLRPAREWSSAGLRRLRVPGTPLGLTYRRLGSERD